MYLKKIVNVIVLSLVAVFISACSEDNSTEPGSGTFVSKKAENKAVLLEEYTGVNCGFCPDGHRIGDSLSKAFAGKFFNINIHAGSYAARYSTQVGGQLLAAFPVQGFPQGVVNRQRFANVYGQNRGMWASQAKQIMNMPAYANIAARADIKGRKLTVRVQVYFTDDSNVGDGENYVHIALLQDNVWGPQSGGKTYYPEMWDDTKNQYRHNHMLRAMITGLNGETVGKNKKGTLYRKTFTYDIPEKISNEDVVLKDLAIIAFITEKTPADAATVAPIVINVCKSTLSVQ